MKLKESIIDVLICLFSGIIVGYAYYTFSNSNNFAPGGISGLASMASYLMEVNMGYLMILFNAPIFILVCIFVSRKTGLMLLIYMACQSISLILFEKFDFWTYQTTNNLIFACIAVGSISGFGFYIMLRRFGASGGTYAISSLIKKWHPEKNIAYVSFILDSSVVFISFFVYGRQFENTICTLINLFIANLVVDIFLSGIKKGYRFEIITDRYLEVMDDIYKQLGRGITKIEVVGGYLDSKNIMLVCIIRKKEVGILLRIIKKHENTFASYVTVNDVLGNFVR